MRCLQPPQVFIPKEVHPLDWNEDEGEDSEELQLQAEKAEYNAFMASLFRHRPSQLGSESNTSGPSNSKKSDSSNDSNSGDDEGEEEEEEENEEDEEEMEYLTSDYP